MKRNKYVKTLAAVISSLFLSTSFGIFATENPPAKNNLDFRCTPCDIWISSDDDSEYDDSEDDLSSCWFIPYDEGKYEDCFNHTLNTIIFHIYSIKYHPTEFRICMQRTRLIEILREFKATKNHSIAAFTNEEFQELIQLVNSKNLDARSNCRLRSLINLAVINCISHYGFLKDFIEQEPMGPEKVYLRITPCVAKRYGRLEFRCK